jgi:hypothetical protein
VELVKISEMCELQRFRCVGIGGILVACRLVVATTTSWFVSFDTVRPLITPRSCAVRGEELGGEAASFRGGTKRLVGDEEFAKMALDHLARRSGAACSYAGDALFMQIYLDTDLARSIPYRVSATHDASTWALSIATVSCCPGMQGVATLWRYLS